MSLSGRQPFTVCIAFVSLLVAGAAFVALDAAERGEARVGTVDWSSWLDGADGLTEGLQRGQQQSKPVFLYFYTDWCGYCRQFERELLSQAEMQEYLASIVAVRVNPEAGPAEGVVGRRYSVDSFPSLFVHSAESPVVSQVQRVQIVEGRPVLMAPARFIDVIKTAGAQ
jgi:thiol:disulfide interchange protein DsbD